MSPDLRDRIFRTLVIVPVTVVLTLLVLALEADSPSQSVQCISEETREHIRALSLEGYDLALRNHTTALFAIWLKEPQEEPKRASAGTQAGISAYTRAVALAKNWQPPLC